MNSNTFYAILMIIAGLGIPVMATLNASMGTRLQSPALATVILFIVGTITVIAFILLIEGTPTQLRMPKNTPWYYYGAGVLFVFYIVSISWVAPRFGVANSVAFVLLGQLLAMVLIDHFALFNAPQYSIDLKRIIGLILMSTGVLLVLSNKN